MMSRGAPVDGQLRGISGSAVNRLARRNTPRVVKYNFPIMHLFNSH